MLDLDSQTQLHMKAKANLCLLNVQRIFFFLIFRLKQPLKYAKMTQVFLQAFLVILLLIDKTINVSVEKTNNCSFWHKIKLMVHEITERKIIFAIH